MKDMPIIGRVELVDFPDIDARKVHAKVDTGADLSSIWVEKVYETPIGLECVFFAQGSEYYTGKVVAFKPDEYSVTRIASSFGHRELRFKVYLRVRIKGRLVRATFTLSKRANKTYPVLLGRRLLNGKFLVDVSQGKPLRDIERQKKEKLEKDLESIRANKIGDHS